jgi:hypothetical protein
MKETINSISKFIASLAALIAAAALLWLVVRIIDFDGHVRVNVLHMYDSTVYMRPPGLNKPAEPQDKL